MRQPSPVTNRYPSPNCYPSHGCYSSPGCYPSPGCYSSSFLSQTTQYQNRPKGSCYLPAKPQPGPLGVLPEVRVLGLIHNVQYVVLGSQGLQGAPVGLQGSKMAWKAGAVSSHSVSGVVNSAKGTSLALADDAIHVPVQLCPFFHQFPNSAFTARAYVFKGQNFGVPVVTPVLYGLR